HEGSLLSEVAGPHADRSLLGFQLHPAVDEMALGISGESHLAHAEGLRQKAELGECLEAVTDSDHGFFRCQHELFELVAECERELQREHLAGAEVVAKGEASRKGGRLKLR